MSSILYFLRVSGAVLFSVLSVVLGFGKVNIFAVTAAEGQTPRFLSAFLFAAKRFQGTNEKCNETTFFSIFFRKY